jgi:hypothetical protein
MHRNRRGPSDSSWVDVATRGPEMDVPKHGTAIALLVDHTHSIPVSSVLC